MTAVELESPREGFDERSEVLECGCIVHINARELSVRPCCSGCRNYGYIMRGAVR